MKCKSKAMPRCLICSSQMGKLFQENVLHKYSVAYFQCSNCSFIQTEQPYWLDEAYESPINIEDTGILQRTILLAMQLTPFLLTFKGDARMLDYGGGYGFFTRILRDIGFDAYWDDPHCANLTARGFEAKKADHFDIITAFEVFEHVQKPQDLVASLLQRAPYVVFSTQTSDGVSDLQNWWYMGYSHGQHISLYSKKSIQLLAKMHGATAISIGSNVHVISKNPLSHLQKLLLQKYFIFLFPIVFLLRKSKTYSDHMLLRK